MRFPSWAIHLITGLYAFCTPVGEAYGQVQAYRVTSPAAVSPFEVSAPTAPASYRVALEKVPEGCSAQASSPLPLRPLNLTARRESSTMVNLEWDVVESESELRWALERRLEHETDFTEIQALPLTLILRQRHTDRNAYSGYSYYRLRGMATDGAVETSQIQAVDNTFQQAGLMVYPNPLRTSAIIYVPSTDQSYDLLLTDNLGRKVRQSHHQPNGGNTVTWELPDLPPGLYLLRWLVNDEVKAVERVVVSH